ncbi:calcium-activated chloride channel regulator 2-like [Hyalella azteca]|uniref:Calcium-activated chloride channel regulator 2-like n=1 Tax=Hyalella azteca TaxID=294128 RepID=A0A8B7N4T1_HYAAZ|nr:calcium-activated chloride channel regulator 2-like [Hyalella azteca]
MFHEKTSKNIRPQGSRESSLCSKHKIREDFKRPIVFLLVVLLLSFLAGIPGTTAQDLKLVDNGYEGLMVAIDEGIPQEQCKRILHGLKTVLGEFSSELYASTGGRASLSQVTVALPRTWGDDLSSCALMQPLTSVAPPVRPHVSITKPHPVFGNRPWAQQTQGCGKPGDRIYVGADLLNSASNDTHSYTARLLLAEWAKFRWGIFEERGHYGDALYPPLYRDPTTHRLRPNECSDPTQNQVPFCSSKQHVPEAPTKHNALCGGRPAWDIITQSDDFSTEKNLARNLTGHLAPSFRFVQESSPRFVLAVEDTAIMNMQRRWEFVRKAVRRVAVYDIPDGAHVALVVFNSVARTVAPLSKMDSVSDVRQRVGSSLPRNPSTVPESHKCVLCGLQEALRALDSDSIGAAGANIILITTGAGAATHHQMDEMIRLVQSRRVRVTPILYPLTERPGTASSSASQSLESLVLASGGSTRTFTVMDEGVGNDSKVSMLVALMDALLAAVRVSGPVDAVDTPVIVESTAYPGGIASMSSGSFTLDDSLGPDVRFSVYYYDLNHVGNAIQLTTPTGQVMSSVNMQEEDGDANVIFVNIPKAERGIWRYKVENRADSHQGLHVQVAAWPSKNRNVNVRVWTSNDGAELNPSDPAQPIILFAEVRDGDYPILNAHVVAKLQRLGTNTTGSGYKPTFIELFDKGIGDPDITSGDGVYSRYLPQMLLFPGHYELTVTATHNNGLAQVPAADTLGRRARMEGDHEVRKCCGSVIAYKHVKPVAPFNRQVPYGVISVVHDASERDIFPPSRILDLRAQLNETTRLVTLKWTAPGDDYDWGRANFYEAVIADSYAQAKAMDGEQIPGLPTPNTVPTEQVMTFEVKKYDQMIYIAVRAIDSASNRGGVSNVATLLVPQPPTTPPPPMTFPSNAHPSASTEPRGRGVTQPIRLAGLALEDIAVIGGVVGGFIVIIAIFAIVCVLHLKRRRKHSNKKEVAHRVEANRNVMVKSNSAVVIDHEDSHDSADSTVKDAEALKPVRPLSPVQSWAASKLLAEHERRFSVTSGPVMPNPNHAMEYNASMHDPFPDVTLTGTHSYPSSQTPSTTHSDPPAYQQSFTEGYAPYPYQYATGYSHEDLPPYTPGLSSQSSQASTAYAHEVPQPAMGEGAYPAELHPFHPSDMPAFVSDNYNSAQAHMYAPYPDNPNLRPMVPARTKVPPPVAPKPQGSRAPVPPVVPTTSSNGAMGSPSSMGEPKRRNVTQV